MLDKVAQRQFYILIMSREKVKEEKLGPKNGAEFTIRTWHEYLCEVDKGLQHPISVDHEIPFNISTVLIE
jgi:hypothetical protein